MRRITGYMLTRMASLALAPAVGVDLLNPPFNVYYSYGIKRGEESTESNAGA